MIYLNWKLTFFSLSCADIEPAGAHDKRFKPASRSRKAWAISGDAAGHEGQRVVKAFGGRDGNPRLHRGQ
jgi:hypothetical protein